jgi:hypothetical protein
MNQTCRGPYNLPGRGEFLFFAEPKPAAPFDDVIEFVLVGVLVGRLYLARLQTVKA